MRPAGAGAGGHESGQDPPNADDTDHSMNAQSANPAAHGNRVATGGQPAIRSSILCMPAVPSIRGAGAATRTTTAMIRNVAGVADAAAENHSSTASRRRTAAAPTGPGPAMNRRALAKNLRGRRRPCRNTAPSSTDRTARAMAKVISRLQATSERTASGADTAAFGTECSRSELSRSARFCPNPTDSSCKSTHPAMTECAPDR